MKELIYQMKEPNEVERAIIEWNVPALKKYLIDQNILLSLGYDSREIDHMQIIFFGIKFPNPGQMTYFEKAVYLNDKKTVENYYHYMNHNKSAMEGYGYTQDDLKNIQYVHIEGNKRFLTSRTDDYEIATRLSLMQSNKNRMTEMYVIKYLKEASDLLYKKEALNRLVMIYREEEYLSERKDDFKRLISLFPEILEYSQLARSFHIELLYRDHSDEKRYQKICERGDYYEQQLDHCLQIKIEKAKYIIEEKAKYLYAISISKTYRDGWSYFVKNQLHKQTNVTYMKDFLEASGEILKIYLEIPERKKLYTDILQTMSEKAKGKKGGANYGFLLYLNRKFGTDFGIDWGRLEELYKNADYGIKPFDYNGYGTYLYALAQEYTRIHNNLDEFPYKKELLCLKKEFYSYYSEKMDYYLMDGPLDCETIRSKISCINNSILSGEKKFLHKKGYRIVKEMPRYLCFFPEQEQELYDKYEEKMQRALASSRKSNSKKDMLNNLELPITFNPSRILDDNADEVLKEISFYIWKEIQLNFDQSKDQWLILGKIYECYMKGYQWLGKKERTAGKKIEYRNLQLQWAKKVANTLRIRAELYFVYDDWYDLYQFYLKQANNALNTEEKSDWIKLAYELYLEIAYKIQNDSDQVGMHFTGLRNYYLQAEENCFKLCIMKEKSIAARYIEEFAKLYYQHRQYRYLSFAFEITKVTGDYELYLRKFLKALVQWEMVQLIRNILYLLKSGEYGTAQLFYNYSAEHVNPIPPILNLTHDLIEGLVTAKTETYKNILNLLETYPNVKNYIFIEIKSDEGSVLDNIMALNFIMKYYTCTKELTGELDGSSIQYALYQQFQYLYLSTMKEEYLEKMFDALESAATEKEHLPSLYKVITLRYRYERLNSYTASIIDKRNLSPEITDRLKEYQGRLESLKNTYDNGQGEVFQELCDLTIRYSEKTIINKIKAFIKKHVLSGRHEMTEDLRDYLMSFKMIGRVWLQLYFEEDDEIVQGGSFADYTRGFDSVNQVIGMLEDSNKFDISVLNLEILKSCVFNLKEPNYPYMALLVQDYLKNNSFYSYEGVEILHHFFGLMTKEKGTSLYRVIDAINKEFQYKNAQCIALLGQLYKKTKDVHYLTGLARQYAKACNYEEAEKCYIEASKKVENNSRINTQILAMSLLILVNHNKQIKISAMENISAKQVCEVLAYLSRKYPDEVDGVMERMEEEESNLFNYIHQLISFEKKEYNNKKNKHNSEISMYSYEEEQEEKLLKLLLSLKDTIYFSYLLPNLYQRSKNAEFKYSIESLKDNRIQTVLKEGNNKPILVLYEKGMKPGQKLIFMDYGRQARNVNVNLFEENQDIPLLQEVINNFHSNDDVKPVSDLLLQLEGEKSGHNRKDILLHILADQSYHPEAIEGDAKLQRKLQLSKAELGYLLHLEEFEKKNYAASVRVLHEGTICLGSSKSDCRYLLEKIRGQYCKVLEVLPKLSFYRVLKFFPLILYDMQKIVQLLDNWNNSINVFFRDMISIIGRLQTFGNPINQGSDIDLLESVMDSLASLEKGEKFISRVTNRWEPWVYNELLQIVNKDTIRDKKYFIDRKESKGALKDFYQEVIDASCHINLYGPKGMGVSSLLRQCYEVYYEEALRGGNLFLFLDSKEIIDSYDKEDFSKRLFEEINREIQKINDFKPMWGTKIHLFLDHYEEFQEAAKAEMDQLLYKLANKGIHLVIGSEPVIKVQFIKFSEIELKGFSENETREYISDRMKYRGDLLPTIPVEGVYKLTGGIPALLSYMVKYFLEYKVFTDHDGKAYLMNKAKLLFEHWDTLWLEKLNREDNAAYRSHVMAKDGHSEQDISGRLGELEAMMNRIIMILGKESYIRQHKLENEKDIDLDHYQRSIQWTQEVEVDIAEFGIQEEIWEVIKKENDVYQYIKYGEALRRLTHDINQSDYDYSVFALNYCLAFELISNTILKAFLMRKIPEYDVSNLSQCYKEGIARLKDSRDTTNYTLGNYVHFLTKFKKNCYNELHKIDFDFKEFHNNFSLAKDIRNKVAHVGDKLNDKEFLKFLSLLFGDRNSQKKQQPVFEGICRLAKMIG